MQYQVAGFFVHNVFQRDARIHGGIFAVVRGQFFGERRLQLGNLRIAGLLIGKRMQNFFGFFAEFAVGEVRHFLRQFFHDVFKFRFAGHFAQLHLGRAHFVNFRLGDFHRFDDGFFFHFFGAAFHHQKPLRGTGNHEVHITGFLFGFGGVDDELPVLAADAHRGDRFVERNGRNNQRGGRSEYGQHIGVVLVIAGDNHRRYVGFASETFRENRADGAVNNAGRQRFFLAGAAFAFEKTAGDFARGVGSFFIIDGKRSKIGNTGFLLLGGNGGGQHHRFTHRGDYGAVGLFGD